VEQQKLYNVSFLFPPEESGLAPENSGQVLMEKGNPVGLRKKDQGQTNGSVCLPGHQII